MGEHDKDYDLSYKVGQLVGRVDALITLVENINKQHTIRFEDVEKRVDNHNNLLQKGLGIIVSVSFIFSVAISLIGDWLKKIIHISN